jgi:hypothetical protein
MRGYLLTGLLVFQVTMAMAENQGKNAFELLSSTGPAWGPFRLDMYLKDTAEMVGPTFQLLKTDDPIVEGGAPCIRRFAHVSYGGRDITLYFSGNFPTASSIMKIVVPLNDIEQNLPTSEIKKTILSRVPDMKVSAEDYPLLIFYPLKDGPNRISINSSELSLQYGGECIHNDP